jgi:hypothetical protein
MAINRRTFRPSSLQVLPLRSRHRADNSARFAEAQASASAVSRGSASPPHPSQMVRRAESRRAEGRRLKDGEL